VPILEEDTTAKNGLVTRVAIPGIIKGWWSLLHLILEIAFTIAAPAFDILFIGCVLNTKIAYTTAEKCCKMLLENGEARRRRNKRELVDARPSNAARCC